MKLFVSIVLAVLLFQSAAHMLRTEQVDRLPGTPKASQLKNHFGIPTDLSPYGVQNKVKDMVEKEQVPGTD